MEAAIQRPYGEVEVASSGEAGRSGEGVVVCSTPDSIICQPNSDPINVATGQSISSKKRRKLKI